MDNEQIKKYSYNVVAVYMTNIAKSGGYYNYLHGNTREEQIEYLQNKIAAYQLYDTGLTVAKEDELLSLSTCEYSSTNGRLIVLAKVCRICIDDDAVNCHLTKIGSHVCCF